MKNPIFYIESHTDLIVGGPCDGMRMATPFDSEHAVVMLHPPPAEQLTSPDPSFRRWQDITFEVQAPVPYDIATICVPDGTADKFNYRDNSGDVEFLAAPGETVDRVIRIWYRKFQELSETEAIALLFKNYKRQEETWKQ